MKRDPARRAGGATIAPASVDAQNDETHAEPKNASNSNSNSKAGGGVVYGDDHKVFISRIPVRMDEARVHSLLQAAMIRTPTTTNSEDDGDHNKGLKQRQPLDDHVVVAVQLVYKSSGNTTTDESDGTKWNNSSNKSNKTKNESSSDDRFADRPSKKSKRSQQQQQQQQQQWDEPPTRTTKSEEQKQDHCGYGFATLSTVDAVQYALETVRTLRATPGPTNNQKKSSKAHTLYLGPVRTDAQKEQQQHPQTTSVDNTTHNSNPKDSSLVCFLWTAGRCPYAGHCKFAHTGPGGVLVPATKPRITTTTTIHGKPNQASQQQDAPPTKTPLVPVTRRLDAEKDCIDWKTKGKCRNLVKNLPCPYKHDPAKQKKKKQNNDSMQGAEHPHSLDEAKLDTESSKTSKSSSRKVKQPLTIRVFGLNYETTEASIRTQFATCGPIAQLIWPTFPDSGRSKGYCGISYSSPQAVNAAVTTLHQTELDGRWISVQAGKMLLDEWEQNHHQQQQRRQQSSREATTSLE